MYDKKKIQNGIQLHNERHYFSDELSLELIKLVDKATTKFQIKGIDLDIEDLKQSVILKLLLIISQGKVLPEPTAAAYLYTSAIHASQDYVRSLHYSKRILSKLYREHMRYFDEDTICCIDENGEDTDNDDNDNDNSI